MQIRSFRLTHKLLPTSDPRKSIINTLREEISQNPVYGKSLYAVSIEGRFSNLPAAVRQSPNRYPAS
jgi:hypothetical protein